ncbi:MAG: undecaprenyl-diphosphate phosphatase [Alphaproteobacteria bacterium]|jgi:undecaprenyl-diphosphatase|nr:undecaprenyl-diphosphate phosphatase [Alphaproteobacteria bacterium]
MLCQWQISFAAMSFEHILILALIQGVTEFIPVSSSGHLNLLHALTDRPDQGVVMDVALHGGTLLAVMAYFRADVARLILGGLDILRLRPSQNRDFATLLLLASLPVLLAGAVLMLTGAIDRLRHLEVVAWASIIFAVPLWLADKKGAANKDMTALKARPALLVGGAQMLALIPGASRAGVTIMAARALGFDRQAAARFSMLLSMPVIAAFTLAGLAELVSDDNSGNLADAGLGALLAAVFAFATIHLFLRMAARFSLTPFIIYRIALGVVLLTIIN